MKRLILTLLTLLPLMVAAQLLDPVQWNADLKVQGDTARLTLSASIDKGWHLYATELPAMDYGPEPTSLSLTSSDGLEKVGELQASKAPIEAYDETFEAAMRYWEGNIVLTQKFLVTDAENLALAGKVNFMACNDQNCTPPTAFDFSFGAETAQAAAPVTAIENPWWKPVEVLGDKADIASASLWSIFIWGFLGGLLALFTPCVWPMIPLTVSFFLKKSSSRSKSIGDALTYGLSIIVIYLVLGLAVTLIFGAGKLNDLSTNAVFNLIFFALLVVFAISFFGAFDIKLPARWSNSIDSKAENATGLVSIFFMAFTLALVSFSCTGPIIGTLLVEAATMGNIVGPAVGMGAFALALAIPFALFALFPSIMKSAPRSGGWMNTVKVVLGFLELALSLKFLSVADLAYGWRLLDREVFVALWVVIFALLGLYLLGKLRFSHDAPAPTVGIGRFFLALFSLSFSVYLLPGLWGAPLKGVSAFVPPLFTQDFNLYSRGSARTFSDYDEGMRYAAEQGMPVFMDFSGYGCVNCRKMEGAVFDNEEIARLLGENFVVVELMVDDKTPLAQPFAVEENGRKVNISTVGEKWSYLQRHKFAANSQPYYIVLDNQGQAISPSYGYNEDISEFKAFLDNALEAYR